MKTPSVSLLLSRTSVAALALLAATSVLAAPASVRQLVTADHLEPLKQGETVPGEAGIVLQAPYSKGVNVVGHDSIQGRTGNLDMTWSGHCAYVASGIAIKPSGQLDMLAPDARAGVAVIDVHNPSAPRTVRLLRDKGSLNATETLHAVTLPRRAVLAASTYGGVAGINGPKDGWLSLYDVRDCANPRLTAELKWPEPVHMLRVSPDARYVYGTVLNPFTGEGGIEVMDISDLARPRFVGKFAATRPDGTAFQFGTHALVFSANGRRIYAGVTTSQGADVAHEFKNKSPGVPSPAAVGQETGGMFIFDNSDFAERRPNPKLRLIGSVAHAGWHSPTLARIAGRPSLVSAGELGACPGAWPRIIDISDERRPKVIGEFRLAMNFRENCPEQDAMEKGSGGLVGRAGTAASHFQDVDDAQNTRLGLFPFIYAGVRFVDLRDPRDPTELAYFKPGDPCMSHVRYVRETGHAWFACNASGFYVVQLKPQVRAKLQMGARARR